MTNVARPAEARPMSRPSPMTVVDGATNERTRERNEFAGRCKKKRQRTEMRDTSQHMSKEMAEIMQRGFTDDQTYFYR